MSAILNLQCIVGKLVITYGATEISSYFFLKISSLCLNNNHTSTSLHNLTSVHFFNCCGIMTMHHMVTLQSTSPRNVLLEEIHHFKQQIWHQYTQPSFSWVPIHAGRVLQQLWSWLKSLFFKSKSQIPLFGGMDSLCIVGNQLAICIKVMTFGCCISPRNMSFRRNAQL